MKSFYFILGIILLSVIIFLSLTKSSLAASAEWNSTKQPPISLIEAYQKAVSAIDKNESQFYCIGAGIMRTGTFPDGVWTYYFSSKEGGRLWIQVSMNGQVEVYDKPPIHD